MKFIHLSDLHLGKRVNECSMLEDQAHILRQILNIVEAEQPDGVLIAGDVYDKSTPSAEAVSALDEFLVALAGLGTQVFVISGNHDSPERLAFGGRLMRLSGIHMAPVYGGKVEPIPLTDDYGPVMVYLLPFVKPAHVRPFFPEREIATYSDAIAAAIEDMNIDSSRRNVLVTHQFVTGAARCESEERTVGGTDNVDASLFDPFDYVALGHLHGPQAVGRETVRYCGTPLKYSFSEARQEKSVTVVELMEKGTVQIRTIPLTPLRDMTELRGSFAELTAPGSGKDDYLRITLTDEQDVPDAMAKLRLYYPNVMRLDYDNQRTRAKACLDNGADPENKTPLELLEEFYAQQNGQPMTQEQRKFAQTLMQSIWEGEA